LAHQIDFQPLRCRFSCGEETTIYEAAREAEISLASTCGGRVTCGRCRVRILAGDVSPLSEDEQAILGSKDAAAGYRLACAAQVLGDLTVYVPSHSLAAVQHLALSGKEPAFSLDPVVTAYQLSLPEPGLETPLADWDNICQGLETIYGLKDLRPDLAMLRDLSSVLRSSRWAITVVVRKDEVIEVRPQDSRLLGLALDIGTTTIAAYLVDLNTGRILAAQGTVNPQVIYGGDVMSRLTYAMKGHGKELRESLVGAINRLIAEVTGNPEGVMEVVVVGNSAMHHLFIDLPVKQLGQAPYLPVVRRALEMKASSLGLRTAPGAYAYLLPNIAGFVGADHVAMLLAIGLYEAETIVLGIDIGTNTEIALATGGTITTLSCAAGPAFEGAGIAHGMMANRGAIEKVRIAGDRVYLDIIGNVPPTGICGSGILDAISELRKHNIIDHRGRLQDHPLVHRGAEGREFLLAPASATGTDRAIVITQQDIGEIQLAKTAIRTGINILLSEVGVRDDEISEVIIAGGFGSYFEVRSAIGIGMLPRLPLERFSQVGNAAGVGAKIALVSRKNRATAEAISSGAQYIELTTHPMFIRQFSQALPFA